MVAKVVWRIRFSLNFCVLSDFGEDVKTMPELKKKRDVGIDVAKGFAMFLVVFIHVRYYASGAALGWDDLWAENFSVMACMSTFFVLSGCFSKRLFEQGDVRKLLGRIVACLWPVFTICACAGPLLGWVQHGRMPSIDTSFVRGILSSGWFFFCLALCDVVTFVAYRIAQGHRSALILFLAVCYLVFWSLPVGLFHVCEMAPFFWFGLFALRRMDELRFRSAVGVLLLVICLIPCFTCGPFEKCGLIFHFSEMHLAAFSWKGLGLMVIRIGLGLAGALGVLELVRLCVRRFSFLGVLAVFGTESLGIFFVHVLVLSVYYETAWMGWYGGGLLGRTALSVAILLASFALVKLINANRWIRALVWNPFVLFMPVKSDKVG